MSYFLKYDISEISKFVEGFIIIHVFMQTSKTLYNFKFCFNRPTCSNNTIMILSLIITWLIIVRNNILRDPIGIDILISALRCCIWINIGISVLWHSIWIVVLTYFFAWMNSRIAEIICNALLISTGIIIMYLATCTIFWMVWSVAFGIYCVT